MLIEENKPLAPLTTLGIGGPARWFVEATSEGDIVEATGWARERDLPLFVLGGGSNLLVADAGFDGLVLCVGLRGIAASTAAEKLVQAVGRDFSPGVNAAESMRALAPEVHFSAVRHGIRPSPAASSAAPEQTYPMIYPAAAGEDWDGFVERAVQDNCAGIECLAGIPGTAGGTPVQNVGAYGQEVASVINRVRAFDLTDRIFVEFSAAECGFAYRRSRFNSADRGRYIVTRVDYRLTPGGAPTLRYAELQRAVLEGRSDGSQPSLAEVAAVVRRVRQSKGMLLVEGDPDCRSAGSFFKNPVIAEDQLRRIAERSAKEPPRFPAGPGAENVGKVKVPAAWLIEQAGFSKGYALGRAGVSSRHTLALVNLGGASAAEILNLASQIVAAVEARFGIHLEMEPVMVGF
jgi:UDP-N-acetylmuramate dehydrogenase